MAVPGSPATLGALVGEMKALLSEGGPKDSFMRGDGLCVCTTAPPSGLPPDFAPPLSHPPGDPGALTEARPRPPPGPRALRVAPRRRPGILVMVNDVDWELSGREDTELEAGDTVVFLSTLHGG